MKLTASIGGSAGSQLHAHLGMNRSAHNHPGAHRRVHVRSRITSADDPSVGSATTQTTALSDLFVFESTLDASPSPTLDAFPLPDSSSVTEPAQPLPSTDTPLPPWDTPPEQSDTHSPYLSSTGLNSISQPPRPTSRKTRRERLMLSEDPPPTSDDTPQERTSQSLRPSPPTNKPTDSQPPELHFAATLPLATDKDGPDFSSTSIFAINSLASTNPEPPTAPQSITSPPTPPPPTRPSPSSSSSGGSAAGSRRGRVIRSASSGRNRMAATWDIASGPTQPSPSVSSPSAPVTPSQQDAVATAPAWAQALFGATDSPPEPQLQRASLPESDSTVQFLERDLPMQGFLELRSQEEEDLMAAKSKTLPPLQSLMDITTAHQPPTRSLEAAVVDATETATATAPVGRQLPDGKGFLADGTAYEKLSGEDFGPDGYWKRWTVLKGQTLDGAVSWEESWWETSDWAGYKELGAVKSGTSETGAAWKEEWCEKAYHDKQTVELTIERTAHKWARAGGDSNNEWEEKWGETHKALGRVNKYADKWARDGANVWHEKWGEDYDGRGGCLKYTDKWAEREHWGGSREQWGDKWTEQFADGRGEKHGEVWSIAPDGHRYNRWWNEAHLGDRQVRKWGDSTAGECWDNMEEMDTYYNPIPHFGFSLAVRHSPGLFKVPELSRSRRPPSPSKDIPSGLEALDGGGGTAAPVQQEDIDTEALGQGLGALDWGNDATYNVDMSSSTSTTTMKPSASTTATKTTPAPRLTPDPLSTSGSISAAGTDTAASSGSSLDWSDVLRSVKSKVEKTKPKVQQDAESAAASDTSVGAGAWGTPGTTVTPSTDFGTAPAKGVAGGRGGVSRTHRVRVPPPARSGKPTGNLGVKDVKPTKPAPPQPGSGSALDAGVDFL